MPLSRDENWSTIGEGNEQPSGDDQDDSDGGRTTVEWDKLEPLSGFRDSRNASPSPTPPTGAPDHSGSVAAEDSFIERSSMSSTRHKDQLAEHERYAYDAQYQLWHIVQYDDKKGLKRYLNILSLVVAN
jgi:hypothetical protein